MFIEYVFNCIHKYMSIHKEMMKVQFTYYTMISPTHYTHVMGMYSGMQGIASISVWTM